MRLKKRKEISEYHRLSTIYDYQIEYKKQTEPVTVKKSRKINMCFNILSEF